MSYPLLQTSHNLDTSLAYPELLVKCHIVAVLPDTSSLDLLTILSACVVLVNPSNFLLTKQRTTRLATILAYLGQLVNPSARFLLLRVYYRRNCPTYVHPQHCAVVLDKHDLLNLQTILHD